MKKSFQVVEAGNRQTAVDSEFIRSRLPYRRQFNAISCKTLTLAIGTNIREMILMKAKLHKDRYDLLVFSFIRYYYKKSKYYIKI